MSDPLYKLEILVDQAQFSLVDLEQKVKDTLDKLLPDVDISIGQEASGNLTIAISGSLDLVDKCHSKLNQDFIDRRFAIRTIDESGDKLRAQAFEVLTEIEQKLRSFINRVMTETIGFHWWEEWSTGPARKRAAEVEQKNQGVFKFTHPLEFVEFEHLIELVTSNRSRWVDEQPVSVRQLKDLLCDCKTYEEFTKRLEEKTAVVSIWDNVFASYFADKQSWSELAKELNEVVASRNKVMHHRPFHIWDLVRINEVHDKLIKALGSIERPTAPELDALKKESIELLRESPTVAGSWISSLDGPYIFIWGNPPKKIDCEICGSSTAHKGYRNLGGAGGWTYECVKCGQIHHVVDD